MASVSRRLFAEFFGTALLVAAVVGSGIMATTLTDDVAVQLLVNALATVAALGVLIWVLDPISGAHFNPAVTLIAFVTKQEITTFDALGYISVQIMGAITGATFANVMFALPAWSFSNHQRSSAGMWMGEVVATAGLLLVIGAIARTGHSNRGPVLIPAWIGAAYFFTASTSFANPAVTIGRVFSDTFAGISPESVPLFIVFQMVGAAIGAVLTAVLYPQRSQLHYASEPVHANQ